MVRVLPAAGTRTYTEMRNWLLARWRPKLRKVWDRGKNGGSARPDYKTWLMRAASERWRKLGERQKCTLHQTWRHEYARDKALADSARDKALAALNEVINVDAADSASTAVGDLECFALQEVPRVELVEPASEQVHGAPHVGAADLAIAGVDEAPAGDVAEAAERRFPCCCG